VQLIDVYIFFFSLKMYFDSEFVEVVLLPLDEFQQKIDGEWISCWWEMHRFKRI